MNPTTADEGDFLSSRFDVFPDDTLLELEQAEESDAADEQG